MINMPAIVSDTWLNSKPMSGLDWVGKVVLVDFWTYSCVNCQRTLPFIREWWHKYGSMGFTIIGVHSPEFEFEKDVKNVKRAIAELKVDWPVALDNDHKNWTNFANRYWPAKYLADKNGYIVYNHFGEGSYAETEAKIQELLAQTVSKEMPGLDESEHQHGAVCFRATPETYCGYNRGRIENPIDFQDDKIYAYKRPLELKKDSIALNGKFLATAEYAESAAKGAALILNFKATEVNLVLHTPGKESLVEIRFNNDKVPQRWRGADLDRNSYVKITKPGMYKLIKANEIVQGELSVTAVEGNYRAFAFTFLGCIYPATV
jgi:thiol-disulfide isomerase/thioredoxin